MKLSICSDIHLNFLEESQIFNFVDKIDGDALLIVGDISESNMLSYHMSVLSYKFRKPIYFVLGNHDIWKSNFSNVEQKVTQICENNKNVSWLTSGKIVELSKDTCLIGVDGWYDALYGDWQKCNFIMNDWRYIEDFSNDHKSIENFIEISRKRSYIQSKKASLLIDEAANDYKNIVFATHVPPWPQVSKKRNGIVDEHTLPYYSSKFMGDAICMKALEHPEVKINLYCGHCHTKSSEKIEDNLYAHSLYAQYGDPKATTSIVL